MTTIRINEREVALDAAPSSILREHYHELARQAETLDRQSLDMLGDDVAMTRAEASFAEAVALRARAKELFVELRGRGNG